jgi:O-acetyl-ADP-ribose deacetylase (regulator of RNase III)
MPFRIIRDDITRVRADAIVNTANPSPAIGRGTDFAVYMAAGARELLEERRRIGRMQVGEVFATPAFRLPAKHIIHVVGPGWEGGGRGELEQLATCYRKALLLARQMGLRSIAFPLIATGVNGFPKDRALQTAQEVIRAFLELEDMDVTLVVFNREAFVLSTALVRDVQQFIDDNRAAEREAEEYGGAAPGEQRPERRPALAGGAAGAGISPSWFGSSLLHAPAGRAGKRRPARESRGEKTSPDTATGSAAEDNACHHVEAYDDAEEIACRDAVAKAGAHDAGPVPAGAYDVPSDAEAPAPALPSGSDAAVDRAESLQGMLEGMGESFRDMLLRLIREKGLDEKDVYKKANLDRRHFSKIRSRKDYVPTRQTAVALAFALGLDLAGTEELLRSAGMALSRASKFDLIILYCLEKGIRDVYKVNDLLFTFDQPMLGCQAA